MRIGSLIIILILTGIAPVTNVIAASCSCAGVPLLSSMDTSSTEPGKFYFNYTAEVHEMSDLVQGSSEINDETGRECSSLSSYLR